VFFKTASSANLKLYFRFGLELCWLLCQSFEVGPGYYFYLEGFVGFDDGGRWVVSLIQSLLRPGVFSLLSAEG
jgi:hypothetical protein